MGTWEASVQLVMSRCFISKSARSTAGAQGCLCRCEDKRIAISPMVFLSSSLRAFLQHAKIDLVEAFSRGLWD